MKRHKQVASIAIVATPASVVGGVRRARRRHWIARLTENVSSGSKLVRRDSVLAHTLETTHGGDVCTWLEGP